MYSNLRNNLICSAIRIRKRWIQKMQACRPFKEFNIGNFNDILGKTIKFEILNIFRYTNSELNVNDNWSH